MQMAVIIDIILAVVLVVFAVLGWRRGAFKSVIGIVIVVAALIGAGVISQQGAPMAAKALAPVISQQIEARFEENLQTALPSGGEAGAEEAAGVFSAAGLYQKTAEKLAQDAVAQAQETGRALIYVAVESMIQSIAGAVLFLLSFLILLIALKILSKVLGLLTAVPGLHLMNAALGGAFGLLQGCLVLFAVVWAVQFFGNGVPEAVVGQSVLFRFFALMNPIGMAAGL